MPIYEETLIETLRASMSGPAFYAAPISTIVVAGIVGMIWANSDRGSVPKTLLVLALVFWLIAGIAFLLGK